MARHSTPIFDVLHFALQHLNIPMYSHDRIAIQRMLVKIDFDVVAKVCLNWFERFEAEI